MARDNEAIVKIKTYDADRSARQNHLADPFGDPTVKVGIQTHEQGITLNLPGGADFGPNVHIERRPEGFHIAIAAADDIVLTVLITDKGQVLAHDERGNELMDYREPVWCDECNQIISDEHGDAVKTGHTTTCSLHANRG